jgi:penicillin-binding protein activator
MQPLASLRLHRTTIAALAIAITGLVAGCGGDPVYVRGSQVEGLDDQAMSTGIDKRDIEQMLHENMKSLMESPLAKSWSQVGDRPTIAIFPMINETSEHIDGQLQSILSEEETFLVSSNLVTVVSRERQDQMIAEVERQHGGHFDPNHAAEYGRQLGAKYYITGKVYTADERAYGEHRVQYFMFMQCIETATSAIRWQNRASFTKALIRD